MARDHGPTPGSPADQSPEADPHAVARAIVLRRLTAAPRSRADLAGHLATRGVPDDVAAEVLDRFEEVGLVNDADYAELLVRSRQQTRGLSKRAIAAELHRKGIDRELAQQALDAVTPESEEQAARRIAARKAPSLVGLPDDVAMRRLIGLLGRRGYSGSIAISVARDTLRDARATEAGASD